jgi:prepilin-type N-terminal cleavage/methylation domain-containing protein
MTSPAARRASGFTLIEIIVSLVLLGILAATVFGFMGQAVRGFFLARDAMELTQKAQVALNKMRIELTYLQKTPAPTGTATSLSYTAIISGGTENNTIAYDAGGDRITWNGVTLIDDVGGLTFAYYDGPDDASPSSSFDSSTTNLIGITLVMLDSDGNTATFTTRLAIGKLDVP